jgi:beta-lactamase superfamily II metal-dependent hydrolase
MPADLEAANVGTSDIAFAGYPAPFVYAEPGKTKVEQTIWGDYIGLQPEEVGEWRKVRARGRDGWMLKSEIQSDRLLELNFVDVGQGDGCFVVTPKDEHLLIDAGEGDNMLRFLFWRFNLARHRDWKIKFKAGLISHPDSDHYYGFSHLLKSGNFHFETLYHNGLVERTGQDLLGLCKEVNGIPYQTDVIANLADLRRIIDDPGLVGKKWYPNLLKSAVEGDHADDVCMLSVGDSFVPGYESDKDLTIEVLAPVPEQVDDGLALRRLGDDGVTKNGHSVVLRLRHKNLDFLLGGDLNDAAQRYLLTHYTGLDPTKVDAVKRQEMITEARKTFESHGAKACHHGSGHFIDEFLGCVNAAVTVISSGDNEQHAHPRPDALGALGKWGRGERPLIFSTELARSPHEDASRTKKLQDEIIGLMWEKAKATDEPTTDELKIAKLEEEIAKRRRELERAIAVYGLINVRTDGEKLLVAQKLESPRGNGQKWDVHTFEFHNGEFGYVREH